MRESVISVISGSPAVIELVTASVDSGFVVVASEHEQAGGSPRIILLEVADELAAPGEIERLRGRFPGTPIVTLGQEMAPYLTEDHILGSQLDGDRIRRVVRTVVERRDLLDELGWRTALMADSEERFQALVVNSSDIIGLTDKDGTFRYASPSAEGMSGRNLVAMAHYEDVAGVEAFLEAVLSSPGSPKTHSFRVHGKDGGWIDAEVVAANHLDDPLVEGIVINFRDVTQRHQRERELRQKETELRLLFDQLPAVVWTADRDLRITSSRGGGLNLLSSYPKRVKGMTVADLFGANETSTVVAAHLEALQGRSAKTKTFPYRGRLLNVYVEPMRDESGEIAGTIGLTVDVTEQALLDGRLRRSEEQYRSMVETMSEGLVEVDASQNIVFVNRRTCELLGYPPETLLGHPAIKYLVGDEDRDAAADESDGGRRRFSGKYEACVHNSRGDRVDLLVSSTPMLDDEGRYKGSIALLTEITERRRAEDEVRQREQRLQFLMDRVPAVLWTVDRDLMITSSRGGALSRLGFEADELVGSSLASYLGTDDPDSPEIVTHRRALMGESFLLTNITGGRVYETAMEPIRDGKGEVTGAFGFAVDVTERRRAELRLRMQFAVSQTLGEATDVSRAMEKVLKAIAGSLGCSVGFFWEIAHGGNTLQPTSSWCEPACTPMVEATMGLRLKKGEGLPGRVWATQRPSWIADLSLDLDFSRKPAADQAGLVSGFALPIVSDSFCCVLEILSSVPLQIDTELEAMIEEIAGQIGLFVGRVNSQEEIRLSRARLAEAQRIARIGSWEWDPATDRVDVSDELLNIFCIEPAEFGGTFENFLNLFGTEERSIRAILDQARVLQEGIDYAFTLRLQDSRIHSFHASGSVALKDGRVSRMVGTIQDVTAQSLLRQEVDRAQRLDSLGRVAASIAHEFNNTLMGISPAAEFLARRGDPAAVDAAKRILQSVQRGKRITGEILRFARSAEPDVESIEVASWLESVARELRQIVGSKIEIQEILPLAPLFIEGDIQQLNQVLINLGLNAADAMPSGGQLFLTATSTESDDAEEFGLPQSRQYVHLEVRDTGSGIDPETVRKIFEPLFTTKKSGTGLGLAVVHQIMTQHQGHIFVVSEPGHGTTFHLFLPATVLATKD